jgi:hypothetical protein
MNTYIYIHICCTNNWKHLFNKLLYDIKTSRLYEVVKEIRVNLLTENMEDIQFFQDEKITIIGLSANVNLSETITFDLLHRDAQIEDFNVLYLHNNHVKYNPMSVFISDWIQYLHYFNIYQHQACLSCFPTYDTVGVNLIQQTTDSIHYSGNVWWSTSTYIRTLPSSIRPEYWVTARNTNKYITLWQSHTNHFTTPYGPHNYANQINPQISQVQNFAIYCLSYNNEERKQQMMNRFTQVNLNVIFCSGVAPTDDRIKDRNLSSLDTSVWSIMYGHLNMLQQFYNSGAEYAILCEDDITLHKDIRNKLFNIFEDVKKLQLDILLLGYIYGADPDAFPVNVYLDSSPIQENTTYQYYKYPNYLWGTQMYLISRRHCKYILDTFVQFPYADTTLQHKEMTPFSADWTITKTGNRALIYPMVAVEVAMNKDYGNNEQYLAHKFTSQFSTDEFV